MIGDVDFNDASRDLHRAVVAYWTVSGAQRLGRHISGGNSPGWSRPYRDKDDEVVHPN